MAKKKSKPADQTQHGIVELVWADPRTLDDNPLNWKIHPKSQMQAVSASIKKHGWVKPLIYNLTTGKLLDGHGRKAKAIEENIDVVPVVQGYWEAEEEPHIIQTLDPLGGMYRTDAEKLESLNAMVAKDRSWMEGIGKTAGQVLSNLHTRMEKIPKAIERGQMDSVPLPIAKLRIDDAVEVEEDEEEPDDSEDSDVVQETIKEDVRFPSSNPWGLPDLLPNMLAEPDIQLDMLYTGTPETVRPSAYYCHSVRSKDLLARRRAAGITGGVYGFFCEDYRFQAAYDNPAAFAVWVRDCDWSGVCAPDFSLYGDWPFPMNLWNLYRSRWAARFWQGLNIPIIPILQTLYNPTQNDIDKLLGRPVRTKESYLDIGMVTLPNPCPIVATECRTIKQHGGSFKEFGQNLAKRIEYLSVQTVIIYGGQEHQAKFKGFLPKGCRYIMLPSYVAERRGWNKKKEDADG